MMLYCRVMISNDLVVLIDYGSYFLPDAYAVMLYISPVLFSHLLIYSCGKLYMLDITIRSHCCSRICAIRG